MKHKCCLRRGAVIHISHVWSFSAVEGTTPSPNAQAKAAAANAANDDYDDLDYLSEYDYEEDDSSQSKFQNYEMIV